MEASFIIRYVIYVFICLSIFSVELISQSSISDNTIIIKSDRISSIDLIEEIESQTSFSFNYNPNDLQYVFALNKKEYNLTQLLKQITDSNNLAYTIDEEQLILYKRRKKKRIPTYTINGYIEDFYSKERLIGAHIIIPEYGKGTITNEYGFFSLTIPQGDVKINSSYIGYNEMFLELSHKKDTSIVIQLKTDVFIEDIEIIAEKKKISEQSKMSSVSLTQKQLNSNPSFLGEADIIRSIKSLPGVSSSNSFNPGLIVRGGGQDQNLILLDGVTLYNITHLLGLFSIFNSDVIKNTTLIKGAFPARYAGRLSSILDIRMNDGDLEQIHGSGSVSMIASKFTLHGPIKKNKTSFIISGRRSYADLIIKPFIPKIDDPNVQGVDPQFSFYDTYFKLQHIINKDHRLFLNLYKGKDRYGYLEQKLLRRSNNEIAWGNDIANLRWNWEIHKKLFANTSIHYLNFEQSYDFIQENNTINDNVYSADYNSSLRDLSFQIKLDYVPSPEHYIRFGLTTQAHRYNPGSSKVTEFSQEVFIDTMIIRKNINSKEFNIFVEDDFKFSKLNINAGINFLSFYVENKLYSSLQPRISANLQLENNLSMKASYSKMTQYNYLVTSESNFFISDLWVTSTQRIKPQNSWLVASGLVYAPNENVELSVEGYYKHMKNVLNYKSGVENTFGSSLSDWESELIQGVGTSYGIELFARQNEGRLNGWISYALSWNWRQYDSINKGEKYHFKYDSRHQFSIFSNYQFTDKINLSLQWNYASGNFTTLSTIQVPIGLLPGSAGANSNPFINGVNASTNRNNYQFSNSHRLDFTLSFTKRKKRYTRIWSIGLFNAYVARNPTFIRTVNSIDPIDSNKIIRQFEEVSILPILPSISYRFEF